jgi:glycosyltransferase involved in cell wall biosynthesis
MEERPLVSILMTAYNREQFIVEAIESVIASTYDNWELIIADDCSVDNTFSIASSYQKKDPRIKAIKNEVNLGDYPNRNCAASYANGEYIVIVDSDDWMFPDALCKWVDAMSKHKSSFGIFSHAISNMLQEFNPEEIIKHHFFNKPILNFGPIATIIKNDYFKMIHGFPEKYGPANDMYFNLKAASMTKTLVFSFPLVNYRIHEGQEINNKFSYIYNNFNYLNDAIKELNLPLSIVELRWLINKNRRRFLVNITKYFLKTFNFKNSLLAVKLANFKIHDLFKGIIHQEISTNGR